MLQYTKFMLRSFKSRTIDWNLVLKLKNVDIYRARGCRAGSRLNPKSPLEQRFESRPNTVQNQVTSTASPDPLTQTFSLANINARSLRNKIEDLQIWTKNNPVNLIAVTETWLSWQDREQDFIIDGFHHVRRDRLKKKGGGVMCYVPKTWSLKQLHLQMEEPDVVDAVWFWCRPRILPRSISGIIGCVVYSPPNISYLAAKKLVEFIATGVDLAKETYGEAKVCIAGDFNQWDVSGIAAACAAPQIVKVPTRGNNTLDLIFTDLPVLSVEQKAPLGNSDHDTVVALFDIECYKSCLPKSVEIECRPHPDSAIRECGRYMSNLDWSWVFQNKDVDFIQREITSTLFTVVDTFFPKKKIKKFPRCKPWMSKRILEQMKKRDTAWKRGDSQRFTELKKMISRLIKEEKAKFFSKTVQTKRYTKPKEWFAHIKKLGGIEEVRENRNEIPFGVEDLNEFFALMGMSNKERPDNVCPAFLPANIPHSFTPMEVYRLLSRIKVRKGQPSGDLPNFFLQEFAVLIAEPIAYLFSLSLAQGAVPKEWCVAEVVPIPKIKSPKALEDFRPISLFPTLLRILEKWVAERIRGSIFDHVDKHQFGGLPARSVAHCLIAFLENVFAILDGKGKMATAMIFDFEKAFNSSDFELLRSKMAEYGCDGNLICWIMTFLRTLCQFVRINTSTSSTLPLKCGIPQGTSLGPVLFIVLINDCNGGAFNIFKFLDDMTSVAEDLANAPTGSQAQQLVNSVSDWSNRNLMSLNSKKCKVLHFNFTHDTPEEYPKILLEGSPIEEVESSRILGVVFQKSLKWDLHVESLHRSAAKLLFLLRKLSKAQVDVKTLVLAYTCFIRSRLEFAVPVWGPGLTCTQIATLESVQRRATRIITKDFCSPYESLLQRLGLVSLAERRTQLMTKFAVGLSKHHIFRDWLPPLCEEISGRATRSSAKRWIGFASTQRRRKSPILFLSHLLNQM